jgi:class 3 adenylate cyclase
LRSVFLSISPVGSTDLVAVTDAPETRYAKTADGVHIAYQAFGEGPVDLVVLPGGWNLEMEWERPSVARFFGRLASFSRVIRFNMRGEGLSDPVAPRDWQTLEQRTEDMLAVLDEVGSERPALLGGVFGGQMMIFFTATHPQRTSALVLFGTTARFGWAPDYPWGMTPEQRESQAVDAERGWDQGAALARVLAPSLADDPNFVSWVSRLHRQSYTPGAARAAARMTFETDLRDLLPTIRVPTLVMCRSGAPNPGLKSSRYLADHIAGARFVELPGDEILMYLGDIDAVVDEVEESLTGSRHAPEGDRVLATVLFTDIVASTERATELGDRRWRDVLDAHDEAVRRQLERFRGREVNTVGDGFLATFDGPGRAILCASAIRDAVRALGIEVRAGLHTGEIELRGDDVAGVAVHIGARVAAFAAPGEVLVSGAVPPLIAGSGIEFDDRGEHELKGVPGTWHLYAVKA